MKIGITEYIDCAHYLPEHDRCNRLHGHTYKVEVTISGDKHAGMVMDFAELRKTVGACLAEFDHHSWNDFLDYPSVENICELLAARLHASLRRPLVVRIWEGEGKWAELSAP